MSPEKDYRRVVSFEGDLQGTALFDVVEAVGPLRGGLLLDGDREALPEEHGTRIWASLGPPHHAPPSFRPPPPLYFPFFPFSAGNSILVSSVTLIVKNETTNSYSTKNRNK